MKILNLRQNTLIVLVAVTSLLNIYAANREIIVLDNDIIYNIVWSQTNVQAQLQMLAETMSSVEWFLVFANQNRGKRPILLFEPIPNKMGERVEHYELKVDFERLLQNRLASTVITGLPRADTSRLSSIISISELKRKSTEMCTLSNETKICLTRKHR